MNKIPKQKELSILKKYKELRSIRKVSIDVGVSKNTVVRVLKEMKAKNKDFKKVQLSRGFDTPHSSGVFHLWVETEPLNLRSVNNNKRFQDALREGRLRALMKKGDTFQIKEYNNLKNVNYWLMSGENWKAKITTKTITISIKLIGKEPLSMIEASNDLIFEKIKNLHKRLGSLFYINAGTPNLRFKTSKQEVGLMSNKVYNKLKELGFRFWNDGFNKVYIDKTPKRSLEASGLDSSLFNARFGELINWLYDNKPTDIATKQDVATALIKCGVLKNPFEPPQADNLNNYIG